MSLERLLIRWRSDPTVSANIVAWQDTPPKPSYTVPFPIELNPFLSHTLHTKNIKSLYSHQELVWEEIQKSHNTVVVTGTASGKTLCYNLPVLNRLLGDDHAKALYLFPTKALSQDQLKTLVEFIPNGQSLKFNSSLDTYNSFHGDINPAIYDGDTPVNHRSKIRNQSRIILSNPDMLHTGILPHHTSWADFLQNLKFIVIDEIHTYRGVFGSHVANVIRRLKRILKFYGSNPIFILTSATIANPLQLAEKITEEKFVLIDSDGSARGSRNFLIYNPPLIDKDLGLRKSIISEGVRLTLDLLQENEQTIIFGRSRPSVELLLSYLKQNFLTKNIVEEEGIRGYRSGYLPRQRRSIEDGLRSGQVRTVVSTNALELGIDIGGVDATILIGYPGTIAATRQQAGRAGRGLNPSLSILITGSEPIDQFLAHHPEFLLTNSPESALVNPDNLLILLDHIRCAAFELPFSPDENYGDLGPIKTKEFLDYLAISGELHYSKNRYFWMSDQYPAQKISLRSSSAQTVVLQVIDEQGASNPVTIGQVDYTSSLWMVHPEAIYLHEAKSFFVSELDLEKNIAFLKKIECDYYTEPVRKTDIRLLEKEIEVDNEKVIRGTGDILLTSQVVGYRKIRWHTHEQLGFANLSLPSSELQTNGYWIAFKENLVSQLRESGLWNNDPNDYGPNWKTNKDLTRKRDGYRCQVCGSIEMTRAHDVHHKIPFRSFDTYISANQLSNLVTLCNPCHRKVEANVRIRSGLAGLAYVIEHLSPLFLMCDIRDIGVHSDPQAYFFDNLPVVIVYEGFPAGLGFCRHLFEVHSELITKATNLVLECECFDGCPSCVGPGGENGIGSKSETLAILQMIS